MQAVKPHDVIPGKPQDPYAIRTILHVDQSQSQDEIGRILCHRITTKDVTTKEISSLFMKATRVKEVLDCNDIKLFEQDFSERKRGKPMLQEDRRFLNMTKREMPITNNGHYELWLPVRTDDVVLPL